MVMLLGSGDSLLRVIEEAFPAADIHVRGNEISATGEAADVALIQRLFDEMMLVLRTGAPMTEDAVERSIAMLRAAGNGQGDPQGETPAEVLTQNILSNRGRTIRPKTLNQKRHVDAIDEHTIVFGIGPAGTGKTYPPWPRRSRPCSPAGQPDHPDPARGRGGGAARLPAGHPVRQDRPASAPALRRPARHARPDSIPRLMAAGTIEVAPLAYMRGRAQPVFTQRADPEGWRPIGSLQVGDLVIGSNGEPTPVLGVYPQGEKDIYRVSAQDGSWTLCCGEHLWIGADSLRPPPDKPWRVLETKEMIGNLRAAHARRYELPMLTAPVSFPEREVPMDPYALGLLLGDGCLTGSTTPLVLH